MCLGKFARSRFTFDTSCGPRFRQLRCFVAWRGFCDHRCGRRLLLLFMPASSSRQFPRSDCRFFFSAMWMGRSALFVKGIDKIRDGRCCWRRFFRGDGGAAAYHRILIPSAPGLIACRTRRGGRMGGVSRPGYVSCGNYNNSHHPEVAAGAFLARLYAALFRCSNRAATNWRSAAAH